LVIGDADCWCDGLQAAVVVLEAGAPWVMPHLTVHRFTEAGSARVYAGEDPALIAEFDQDPYHGWVGGGFVVIRRADYERVPFDPRFQGWGLEDGSAGMAWDCLVGPHVRLGWPLWHLWHPPQDRLTRRVGNPVSEALWRRYRRARGHPDRMAALVAEGSSLWPESNSAEAP
jgi:hypothetical protein